MTLLLLSGCVSTSSGTPSAASAPPVAPSAAGSTSSPSPHEPTGDDADADNLDYTPGPSAPPAGAAVQLAQRFARLWARPKVAADIWVRDLAPLCTPPLAKALRTSDPANVPTATITGNAKAVASRQGDAVFHVPTRGGTLILATANVPGAGWRVTTIDFRLPGQ